MECDLATIDTARRASVDVGFATVAGLALEKDAATLERYSAIAGDAEGAGARCTGVALNYIRWGWWVLLGEGEWLCREENLRVTMHPRP